MAWEVFLVRFERGEEAAIPRSAVTAAFDGEVDWTSENEGQVRYAETGSCTIRLGSSGADANLLDYLSLGPPIAEPRLWAAVWRMLSSGNYELTFPSGAPSVVAEAGVLEHLPPWEFHNPERTPRVVGNVAELMSHIVFEPAPVRVPASKLAGPERPAGFEASWDEAQRLSELGNGKNAAGRKFCLFAVEGDEAVGIPRATIVEAFGSLVDWSPEGWGHGLYTKPCWSIVTLLSVDGDLSLVKVVAIDRPCEDSRFWEGVYRLMTKGNVVLFYPSGEPSIIAGAEVLEHLGPVLYGPPGKVPLVAGSAEELMGLVGYEAG